MMHEAMPSILCFQATLLFIESIRLLSSWIPTQREHVCILSSAGSIT